MQQQSVALSYPPPCIDFFGVAFENLLLLRRAKPARVDVALGVVEILACLRSDAAPRSDHLRGEQYVFHRDHLEKEVDPRLVIHAGIEVDVLQEMVLEQR